jgi:hypothetical protein
MEWPALLKMLLPPEENAWAQQMARLQYGQQMIRTQSTPAPRPGDPTDIQKRDVNDEGFGGGGI